MQNGSRRAVPSSVTTPTDSSHATTPPTDATSDTAKLLSVVRGHELQHADPTYDATTPTAIQRCKTMLSKLRKVLPKLMRPIATVPSDTGARMLRDLCDLLELLLRGRACPHSMALFADATTSSSNSSSGASQHTTSSNTSSHSIATASPTHSTFATMLFYMLAFYTNTSLHASQPNVLRVLLQMARVLQQRDSFGALHVFRDTVEALEDAFLLEEALRSRDSDLTAASSTGSESSASIAAYLNTAIHVYQDADGPLGSAASSSASTNDSNSDLLCGCEPYADAAAVYARKQRLKLLLPSIRVASYVDAVALRRSMLNLAQQLLRQSSALLSHDAATDRLVQLVELFTRRDSALRSSSVAGYSSRRNALRSRVTQLDAVAVTRATFALLETMLRVAATTERTFVRLTLAFLDARAVIRDTSELLTSSAAVLDAVRDGLQHMSAFAGETLWPALAAFVQQSLLEPAANTERPIAANATQRQAPHCVWVSATQLVAQYVRADAPAATATAAASPRLALLVELLARVDITALDAVRRSAMIEHVHFALASPALLLPFTHALVKALQHNSFELGQDGSLSSTSRKRTRTGAFVGSSIHATATATIASTTTMRARADERIASHDLLAQWVLDLVFFGSNDTALDVTALSTALRIVLPFRDWLGKNVSRVDLHTLLRVLVQRVDSVMTTSVATSTVATSTTATATLTPEVLDFVVVALQHLDDSEIAKYSAALESVVVTIEASGFLAATDANDIDMEVDASLCEEVPRRNRNCWQRFLSTLLHPARVTYSLEQQHDANHAELFATARSLDAASQVFTDPRDGVSERAVFVLLFLWSRARALRLLRESSSYQSTRLWRSLSRLVLDSHAPQSAATAAVAMAPMLVPLVSSQCKTSSNVLGALLDLLVAKLQSGVTDTQRHAILEAASAMLCAACGAPESDALRGDAQLLLSSLVPLRVVCTCWQRSAALKSATVKIPASTITALLHDVAASESLELRVLKMRWLACVCRHCQLDDVTEARVLALWNELLARSLDDRASCAVVSELFRDLVGHATFVQRLIAHSTAPVAATAPMLSNGSNRNEVHVSFVETLNGVLTRAEETLDASVLFATLPLLGALGCACNDTVAAHMDVLIWAMLRLLTTWSRAHARRATVLAATAHDQMHRIAMHHGTSWRKLCVAHSERCYFPLVDELLASRSLRLFLRTFLTGVSATRFLFSSAPHVLPIYVVDQNGEMLATFVAESNGADDESSGYAYEDSSAGNGSEPDDGRQMTTIPQLLLDHIEFVLKELIIHQVESEANANPMAEWEFLLSYLPENSTTRDVISHSPLRLLNLVAWELGGARCEAAKKAFRLISQYLSHANDSSSASATSSNSTSMLIPRQYFLAMMTELGIKISAKSARSSADKVRAIKSISQLFSLFATAAAAATASSSTTGTTGTTAAAAGSLTSSMTASMLAAASSSTSAAAAAAAETLESESLSSGVMDPFVPKVMATLKIGLTERELQEHAMLAWAKFLRLLSVKALEANFCSIVVSVLPCIGYDPAMILHERARESAPLPTTAAAAPLIWNVDILSPTNDTTVTTTANNNGHGHKPSAAANAAALGILKFLFLDKRNELRQAFPRIPLLPEVATLDSIFAVLLDEVGDPEHKPLGDYLHDLALYVTHWDSAVREMALTQLFRCLVVRGRELQTLLVNNSVDLFVHTAVADIVHSVLQLARTESHESVKLLCARCLGALGAIDAARMPQSMLYESSGGGNGSGGSAAQGGGSGSSAMVAKDHVDARVEYSTKDLACVLIETWLVKELRAAPENTDSVAFAIQELLKFLAELTADPQHSGQNFTAVNRGSSAFHKSRASVVPVMPEWMKRRFERKDVLQFVEPYWSTSYSVSGNRYAGNSSSSRRSTGAGGGNNAHDRQSFHYAGGADDSTFYEKPNLPYEAWLVAWCKRLIHLSQPPERKIFWACETALSTCPPVARFLLPYLIQNVLRSGRHDVYEELKREVMAVLKDQDRGIVMDDCMTTTMTTQSVPMATSSFEHVAPQSTTLRSGGDYMDATSDVAFADDASRYHQCAQTIFSTIEELNEWVWNSEKKRRALSSSSAASLLSAGSSRSVELPSELEDQEKENLEEFLKGIPSSTLSNAAFGIEAYARAIQYFEVHLRQQDTRALVGGNKENNSGWPVPLALVSKNAFYLQQLYKSVDEPDALVGLATLRRLYEAQCHSSTSISSNSNGHGHNDSDTRLDDGLNLTDLMHQIVDHEQLAQWEDALACYEQAIQEIQSALAARAFMPAGAEAHHAHTRRSTQLPRGLLADPQSDPEFVKPELYSGMIGCLIQLGRLESALQHINGIVTQEPQFVATLFPCALECAWRLSRWDLLADLLSTEKKNALLLASSSTVSTSLSTSNAPTNAPTNSARLRGMDVSQLKLIRVLHSLHSGDLVAVQRHLTDARLEVMGPLAAASVESYQRAYPLLHKLHFLHELEQGFIFLHTARELERERDGSGSGNATAAHGHASDATAVALRTQLWTQQCPWDARYASMPTALKYRDPILALRRVLLQEASLPNEVSHYWLLQAKLARKAGYARTASSAVMHAEALDNQYALLEKAKLFVCQDRLYEALQLLEPMGIDASKIDFNVEDPHFCAKNLLLATNWMQASGQRQGRKVVERYQAVIQFDPKWEQGYFFLAKYYEYLLSVSHPEVAAASSSSTTNIGNASGADDAILLDDVLRSHLIRLLKNYVLALQHGTKFVFQSLPRLLTLWFEYGELLYNNGAGGSSNNGSRHGSKAINKAMRHVELELSQASATDQLMSEISNVINHAVTVLPAYEWLVCFPQVTSRICHPNPTVVDGVKKIIVRVLSAYPTQAMWPLLGLARSLNSQRRNRARDIVTNLQRQFVSNGQQEIATSFSEGMRLVEELISLASHDPANQRKIHIRLSRIRSKILVPVQAALTTLLPASGRAPLDASHTAFAVQAQVYIKAFSDKADVMLTKEKPKRIEVLGSDGRLYPFLCKREKTGDLRKDARMMEFNTMINKLLQKDPEGQKRKLRLRTYAVVCLNEESGLMEWVRNTKAMRQLIGQIHKTERGFVQPLRLTHDIKERFLGMQKKYADRIPHMAEYYRRKVLALPVFTPRFHQWFCNNFADPTAWFEARMTFSRSAAVWSMVGHIIGLGDRHGENILVDCTNGECVHVDFDCLFDKGLKLAKPEIVPFRLTPNMIDAFGICGYEGVFRRVSEVTMQLLRANNETLRSVLESFIHDPLVEWGRKGKATQSATAATAGGATATTGAAVRSIADIATDRSKEETRVLLKTIDDRLRGLYNLGAAIRPNVPLAHRKLLPEAETLPLSVQGQVDKLIYEATAHENLAQMYIGWMPFL